MLMYKFKSEFLSSVIGPKEFFQNEVLKHQGIESSMFFFFFFFLESSMFYTLPSSSGRNTS